MPRSLRSSLMIRLNSMVCSPQCPQDLFFGNILVFGLQQVDYTHWKTTCKARKMPIFFVFFRHYCQKSCRRPHIYAKLWVLTHRFCVSAAAKNDRRSESRSFSKQNFFKEVVPSFCSLCYNLFLATVLDRRTNRQRIRQTL